MKTILVVDDNREILDVVEYALRKEGFEVICAEDGKTSLDLAASRNPNLVILDISMPGGMDGRDVLKALKKTSQVPVIFLTALGDEVERILGLEIGADDYIVKPFSHRELVARVRAVLRRTGTWALGTPSADLITYGPFRLDRAKFRMLYRNEKVIFSRAEFKIVETLLRQPGRVFSRNQLLDAALGFDSVSTDRTIDTHMKRIRQKMKVVDKKFDAFETVRGIGYRLREIA